jgi:hypothetical protein
MALAPSVARSDFLNLASAALRSLSSVHGHSLSLTPGPFVLVRSINSMPPSSSARMSAAMLLGFERTVCTMARHDATGVTTPRQTVKASPHQHKWMLSHGAPADPSDPWNSHAAPVSPRQNGQRRQRVLSHGAPADPSDPWNIHAAPVSPRQNCALLCRAMVKLMRGGRLRQKAPLTEPGPSV